MGGESTTGRWRARPPREWPRSSAVRRCYRHTDWLAWSMNAGSPAMFGITTMAIGWVRAVVTMQPDPGDISLTTIRIAPVATRTSSTVIE